MFIAKTHQFDTRSSSVMSNLSVAVVLKSNIEIISGMDYQIQTPLNPHVSSFPPSTTPPQPLPSPAHSVFPNSHALPPQKLP
mmetsp:Transcript_3577/g.7917  ORF Transcript_3577/g.7917 Transcript_3577/m.7917 type:complete len:82 (-) Transcript_3577:1233-1478(-)